MHHVKFWSCVTENLSYITGEFTTPPWWEIYIVLSPTQDKLPRTHMLVVVWLQNECMLQLCRRLFNPIFTKKSKFN